MKNQEQYVGQTNIYQSCFETIEYSCLPHCGLTFEADSRLPESMYDCCYCYFAESM